MKEQFVITKEIPKKTMPVGITGGQYLTMYYTEMSDTPWGTTPKYAKLFNTYDYAQQHLGDAAEMEDGVLYKIEKVFVKK